jgi:hypothetical protein
MSKRHFESADGSHPRYECIRKSFVAPVVIRGTETRPVLVTQGHTGQLLRREQPEFLMPCNKDPFGFGLLEKADDSD